MKFRYKLPGQWVSGLIGAALVCGVGLFLLWSEGDQSRLLKQASYDWTLQLSLHARKSIADNRVVVVYLDEKSYIDLDQPQNIPIDRSLYAKLLDKMTVDGAKAVVMDVIFSDPGPDAEADQLFTDALRANGHVVLGVDYNRPQQDGEQQLPEGKVTPPPIDKILTFPYAPFRQATAKLGLVVLTHDFDFTARQPLNSLEADDLKRIWDQETNAVPPSLSWAAAELVGLDIARDRSRMNASRWINYYGPPNEALTSVSFAEAIYKENGYFRDKVVFIGARPKTGNWDEKRDELRSPYSPLGHRYLFMPMVEVHATQFLNLMR